MSKYSKNSIYKSEYAVAFQWNKKINPKSINNDYSSVSERCNRNVQENHIHNYRHKLKQVLLEKLEDLEAENDFYEKSPKQRKQNISDISGRNSAITTKSNKMKVLMSKGNETKYDYKSELRRSRSLAQEFKEKNESTQIWWLNEEIDLSSSESDTDQLSRPRSILLRRSMLESDFKTLNHRQSLLSGKISTTDRSQSTNTRSSVSAQMAQATGYQSTTDDFSSFNHDNDRKMSDGKECNTKTAAQLQCSLISTSVEVPRLQLTTTCDDETTGYNCDHIVFQMPYQKEDFIKDTTSSESNIAIAPSADTYRLD